MAAPPEIARANGRLGGRPKGSGLGRKSARTLEREKVAKAVAEQIMKKARPLVRAGMSVALGQQFVYRIDEEKDDDGKTKKRVHVLVTDPEEIANALDQMEGMGVGGDTDEYYYITTKEPDYKAIEMLLSRALGKPKESIDVNANVTFSLIGLAKQRDEMLDGNEDVRVFEQPSVPQTQPAVPELIPAVPQVTLAPLEVTELPPIEAP